MKRKWTIFALVLGMVGALLAIAGVASGEPNVPFTAEGVLRLHLGDTDNLPDEDYFRLDQKDQVNGTYNAGTKQYIVEGKKCDELSYLGPEYALLWSESFDNPWVPWGNPGLVDDGYGVRVSGPQGTRCGQFDDAEVLALQLGSDLDGWMIDYAEIDLEVKFDATVTILLFDTTGPSPVQVGLPIVLNLCTPSDCGPDSADSDNYRVLVQHLDEGEPVPFNLMKFSVSSDGTNHAASLEGGADGTAACYTASCDPDDPAIDDDGENIPSLGQQLLDTTDSLFHLVGEFDGDLDCLENPATEGDDETSPRGTFWRQDNSDNSECILKPYTLTTGSQEIDFEPVGQPNAVYLAKLEFLPEPDPTGPVGIQLYYDDGGLLGSHVMPWCKVDPRDPDDPTKLLGDVAGDPVYGPGDILPSTSETWCLIEADFVSAGTTTGGVPLVDPTYDAYGRGDPNFGLR